MDKIEIIINEIAWMGTNVSANDEWIELYNITNKTIDLKGWKIVSTDKTPSIKLKGEIKPYGFFILERTDDQTLPDILANQIYVGALNNKGENLKLIDAKNNVVDSLDCSKLWFAGNNTTKQTMEKKTGTSSNKDDWQTSELPNGSPGKKNSCGAIIEKQVAVDSADPFTDPATPSTSSTSVSASLNQKEEQTKSQPNDKFVVENQNLLAGRYDVSNSPMSNTSFQDFAKVFLIAIVSAIFFGLIISIFRRFLLKSN